MDWPLPPDTQSGPADADRRPGLFFAKSADASEPPSIVDGAEKALADRRQGSRVRNRRTAMLLAGAGAIALLFVGARWIQPQGGHTGEAGLGNSVTVQVPPIDLPPPNLLRPISPEEAVKENAERPFVNRPDSAASRFVLRTDADDRERAITCLTQAVYYEAAGEGDDGERAVAQVVLNRMRHPGYPASVCGVVYQGADRATGGGCQFTFACDGSLLRTPAPSLWARARKIAEQALAGKVFAPVGHATHYHADYVLPYWADSLDKTVQIGRHIFYRLPSVLGDSRSFFQRYAGKEPELPKPDTAVTIAPSAATAELATALISDAASGTAKEVEKAAEPASPLAIDSNHGTLIADGQAPAVEAKQPKASGECPTGNDGKQITGLRANNLRAGVAASGC
jgi:spore germination cell wall hydrolase CwlJ-like protein